MKLVLIFTVFLTVGYSLPIINYNDNVNQTINTKTITHRIVGGNIAIPHSLPYQIGLLVTIPEGQTWCGGSLISTEYVLTAAHCVDSAKSIMLLIGAHDITNADEPGQITKFIGKSDLIIHPQWRRDLGLVNNDIALIKLPKAITLNDHIQTINLPSRSQMNETFEYKVAIASGWGSTSDSSSASFSPLLRYVQEHIMDQSLCRELYSNVVEDSNLCTTGENAKSTCSGDSGGPLVIEERDGRKTLIGITSFGLDAGCQKNLPEVFTRVTSYLEWIFKNTGIKIRD